MMIPGATGSPSQFPDGFTGSPLANVETISATKVLTTSDRRTQILTPSGATRIAQMPATAILGETWNFVNPAASTQTLQVNASNATTILTLAPGESTTVYALTTTPTNSADWSTAIPTTVLSNGTVSTPALRFTGSGNDTGIYSPSTDAIAFSNAGVQSLLVSAAGLATFNAGLSVTGTTTLPATVNYTSAGSIIKSGAGALTLNNENASTLSIPTAGTYTFPTAIGTLIGSGDTGTVTNAMLAGSISDTKLSTITTAGKVANSATTATSTNTANAIVARDASGNFSAGTITASLNGNASTASTLQTARTINGTSFNGSANITITDGSSLGSLNANNITTGTLAVARGGTGVSSSTGSGSVVLNTSPSLTGLTVNSSSGNLTTINTSDSVAVFNHNSNVSFGVVASLRTSTSGSSTADGPKLHFFRSDGSVNWTVGIAETPSNANWRLNSGGNESGFGTPVMEFTTAGAGFVGPAGNTQTFTVRGALTKTSGSFKIDHPLPSKKDTHYLVHSFVEAPNADNIYRGKVTLIDGNAIINLDTAGRMTEGTFVLLNTNTQSFCSNETGWSAVKSSISGNILTITAEDTLSTDTISWLVIGERHDQHMLDTNWTDENGRVITEPLKEPNS